MIVASLPAGGQAAAGWVTIGLAIAVTLMYLGTLFRPRIEGIRTTEFRVAKWFRAILRDEQDPEKRP